MKFHSGFVWTGSVLLLLALIQQDHGTEALLNKTLCPKTSVCTDDDSLVCGQIGRMASETYISECVLNVLACQAGEKPHFLGQGDCSENGGNNKKLCDVAGPQEVLVKYDETENGYQCVGEEKTVRVCKGLLCEGGSETCCMPTGYEKITAGFSCYDDAGVIVMSGSKVYITVTGCKCVHGDDDQFTSTDTAGETIEH